MRVRVLLFGALKDAAGAGAEEFELPSDATVAQLLEQWMGKHTAAQKFAGSLAVAVNREYARSDQRLQEGDEIALLPPVSGGCAADESLLVRLQREAIDPGALLAQMEDGADGARVIFDGIVRNQTRGRATRFLDYEAYEAMALEQMRALVCEAKQRFEVREIALVHRLGRLLIGESSVWIAVASAHRAAAFAACRWIIDTLKTTVPIWKKEHFEDGAVWADGEPFPAAVTIAREDRP